MKRAFTVPAICLVLLVVFGFQDDCGSGPTNPGVPTNGDCAHYYTCSVGADFGCNPDAPVDFCQMNGGRCIDRGCIPQPGQTSPPSGGGIRITFNNAGSTGGYLAIQKYDHDTATSVGKRQYTKIPANRPADKVARDFCSLSNFLGIYCTASGSVASFYNKQLDIYYYNNNLSQGDDVGFP